MLVVHNSLPVHNVKEFIDYSKAQAAGLDYATSGPGTSTHLAAEMFKTMTGAKLVHVPFKGNAEVLNALLGGHVKVHFALTASTLQHVRSGALARARRHHRKAPAGSAGRSDHRRARLSRLRDQLVAGRVRAGRHAEGHRRPGSTARSSPCSDAGGAGAHHPRGRRSGRQLARAMVRAVSRTKWRNGPRWRKAPGFHPRTERRHRAPQYRDQTDIERGEYRERRHGRIGAALLDQKRRGRRRQRLHDQARKRQPAHQRRRSARGRTARAAACRARST